jgi:hypothetical protein
MEGLDFLLQKYCKTVSLIINWFPANHRKHFQMFLWSALIWRKAVMLYAASPPLSLIAS